MNNTEKDQQLREAIGQHIQKKIPNFSSESDADSSFSRLGLDSLGHVELSTVIEDTIGLQVDPETPFNYPTLNALVEHVLKTLDAESKPGDVANGANA